MSLIDKNLPDGMHLCQHVAKTYNFTIMPTFFPCLFLFIFNHELGVGKIIFFWKVTLGSFPETCPVVLT